MELNSELTIMWFSITVVLVVVELFTGGTLYLLALSSGTLAAGLLAYAERSMVDQMISAIFMSLVATLVVWYKRRLLPKSKFDLKSYDDADIGQTVVVTNTHPLTVHYRGADWQAIIDHGKSHEHPNIDDHFVIKAKQGNILIIQSSQGG